MTFKLGDSKPKSSGRKKGTKNKNTLLFQEGLSNQGFNIFVEFIKIYNAINVEGKLNLLIKAIDYTFPRPRPTELKETNECNCPTFQDYIDDLRNRRDKNDHSI